MKNWIIALAVICSAIGCFGQTKGLSAKVVIDATGMEYRYRGETATKYLVSTQDEGEIAKKGCRVETYSPEKGKGWIVTKLTRKVNIRKSPTTQSAVIGTMQLVTGELPETYPCLGYVKQKETGKWWFRIKVGNNTGYVRADLATWEAINCY